MIHPNRSFQHSRDQTAPHGTYPAGMGVGRERLLSPHLVRSSLHRPHTEEPKGLHCGTPTRSMAQSTGNAIVLCPIAEHIPTPTGHYHPNDIRRHPGPMQIQPQCNHGGHLRCIRRLLWDPEHSVLPPLSDNVCLNRDSDLSARLLFGRSLFIRRHSNAP